MNCLQDVYFTNLNAVFVTGGFFRCGNSDVWEYPKHSFDQNKFYCITKGECSITINDKKYLAKAGDWFFIPAETCHSYANSSGAFEKYWLHCDFYPDKNLFSLLNMPYFVRYDRSSKVIDLFEKITRLSNSSLLSDKITIKAHLLELLAEYVRLALPNDISIAKSDYFSEILRYINENVQDVFTNDLLAEKCFLSTNHFIRRFKELTGYTPMNYVKKVKMETAKRLLESSNLDVSEIAEKVGVYDVSHFCKLFKSFYEKSPTEHRSYYKKHING